MNQLHPTVADQLLGGLADPFRPARPDLNDLSVRVGEPGNLPAQGKCVMIQAIINGQVVPLGHHEIFTRSPMYQSRADVFLPMHIANQNAANIE
jgi:hypothetical protein